MKNLFLSASLACIFLSVASSHAQSLSFVVSEYGNIPYSSDVTRTGARTYTVPIPIADDIKPSLELALSYSSQSGNGIAGYGWNIAGLSSIDLVDKSAYYDILPKVADLNDNYHYFALDGNRLVSTSVGSLSGTYNLETVSGHILAKAMEASGVVKYFIAAFPDGSEAVYGFTDNTSTRITYPLTYLRDIDGNTMTVSYICDDSDGFYYPSQIKFTNRDSTETGRLLFSYSNDRTDALDCYRAGQKVRCNRLLKSIASFSDGKWLCTCSLSHTFRFGVNALTSLGLNCQNSSLPSLIFSYGLDDESVSSEFSVSNVNCLATSFSGGDIRYIRGKFRGDSYSDGLIMLPVFNTYGQVASLRKAGKIYYQFGSLYSADQDIVVAPCIGNYTDLCIKAEDGFQDIEALDVDDDGLDEIVKVNFNGLDGDYTKLRIKIYKFNDGVTALDSTVIDAEVSGVVNDGGYLLSPQQRIYRYGKFSPTGGAHLVTVSYNTDFYGNARTSVTSVINLSSGEVGEVAEFDLSKGSEGLLVVTDMDGDSFTEVYYATSEGVVKYHYDDPALTREKALTGLTASDLEGKTYFYADINGDGLTDILKAPDDGSGNVWTACCYTGSGFVSRNLTICSRNTDDDFMFMDINGDGLSDLIRLPSDSSMSYYVNSFSGFPSVPSGYVSSVTGGLGFVPANVTGLFFPSNFITVDGPVVKSYRYSDNLSSDRLLTKFSDSRGVTDVNVYADMTSSTAAYCRDLSDGYSPSEGFERCLFPMNLLYNSETFSSPQLTERNKISSNYYVWYDAVYNTQGLGFCGFRKMRCTDYMASTVTVTKYDPEKRGVQVGEYKSLYSSPDSVFWKAENTYDDHTTTYGKLCPRLTGTVTKDVLSGLTESRTIIYGSYDYPSTVFETRKIDGYGISYSTAIYNTYAHKVSASSSYVLGLKSQESVDRMKSDSSLRWRDKKIYTYDDDGHLVGLRVYTGECLENRLLPPDTLKKESAASAASPATLPSTSITINPFIDKSKLISKTVWTYDAYGNVVRERTYSNGATAFTEKSWTYDSTHRRLASETDELGRTKCYGDYSVHGNPGFIVNHHGDTTRVFYDAWGSPVRRISPDGGISTSTTLSGGPGAYFTRETTASGQTTVTYFDALGRKIHTASLRFDGMWQCTDYVYGAASRLSGVSLPYRVYSPDSLASNRFWNTIRYDAYGRKSSLLYASGKTSQWTYNGATTSETSDGITHTRTVDAGGNVVLAQDVGGTASWTFRPDGNPLSVTTGGATTTFGYDSYGRRTTISDPSAGTQTDVTTYNADGTSIRTQKGSNGRITTRSDKFGRPYLTVYFPGDTVSRSYDDYGHLLRIRSSNGTSVEYGYDRYDRFVSEKETGPDGLWLQKTLSYSAGGQVGTVCYSTSDGDVTTENYLYSNGQQVSVILPDSTIVLRIESENDFGEPVSVTTGGLLRSYGYDPYGLPLWRKTGGGAISNTEYSFQQATGNLLSRTDCVRGKSEQFVYDSLNRLTAMSSQTVSYSASGNITGISGVGTMAYGDSSQPYKMTSFTPADSLSTPPFTPEVSYTPFGHPSEITGGGMSARLVYGSSGKRVKMISTMPDSTATTRYYIGDRYEADVSADGNRVERLYLGGDAYSAPMVLVRHSGDSWRALNIVRDHLGSITHILSARGDTLLAEYSYTPWGRQRDPFSHSVYAVGCEPELYLGRGFTSHEHLGKFGIINMNARLYNPLTGRFLSPDPYVQSPDFTQSFNRYAYALNNPLINTDKSGEFTFVFLTLVYDFFRTLFTGGLNGNAEIRQSAWQRFDPTMSGSKTNNAWKIFAGGFKTDSQKSGFNRFIDLTLRWSYEYMQTWLGQTYSYLSNMFDRVDVSYFNDATVVNRTESGAGGWGVTLGPYINTLNDDKYHNLVSHEFGHTIQSRYLGPLYLRLVGVPSLWGAAMDTNIHNHDTEWYETWANRLSYNYRTQYPLSDYASNGWNDYINPRKYTLDWYFIPTLFYSLGLINLGDTFGLRPLLPQPIFFAVL